MTSKSKRTWFGIIGICIASLVQHINFAFITIAIPVIQKAFNASILELQWMLNLFGIMMAVFLVTMGRLADTFGRKFLFIIGTFGTIASSLIAAFALSPLWIILAQGVMGISCAIMFPVSQSLISHAFDDHERPKAVALWAATIGFGLAVGPIVGGALIHVWGWRAIFFANIPVALLGLVLTWIYATESKSQHHKWEFDFWGLFILAGTIASLVIAVLQGPRWKWTSPESFVLFTVFVVFLCVLIYTEKRSRFPIIHPEFFLKRTFLFASLGNFCMTSVVWAVLFLMPLYLQKAHLDTPLQTGYIMLFATVPLACLSSLAGKLYSKVGPRFLMSQGFILLLISVLLQYFFEPKSSLWLICIANLFFGVGIALILGPSNTAAVSALPKDIASIASGGILTVQEIGGTLGLTIVGTLFRSVNPQFMAGFKHGLYGLVMIIAIGLFASLFLRR